MTEHNMMPMSMPRRVITRTMQSQVTEYTIRIARPIGEIDEFEEELMALEEATDQDLVYMQISSPGGSLETCEFLTARMKDCHAPIVVEIGMLAASAASALCLQADDWVVNDSSTMMIHGCSYSPGYGREVEVRTSVAYTERVNREWVQRVYRGFLTEEQIVLVLDGKDLYFYSDDLREMLPKYKEYRQSRDDGDCSFDEDMPPSLDTIIEDAVSSGVAKALETVLKKYDLVEKPKPVKVVKPVKPKTAKARPKKNLQKLIDETPDEAWGGV